MLRFAAPLLALALFAASAIAATTIVVDSKDKCPKDAVVLANDDGTVTCVVY